MRKKDILALAMFGRFSPLRPVVRRIGTKRLVVLAYHRINDEPDASYPFQEDTVSATPEMFRQQLAFLKRYCFVTTFKELAHLVAANETIPDNTVIITFDDGYRDNYDIALPILSEFKLPAVVYVVTENIDSGQPFWFDILSYALIHAPNGRLSVLDGQHTFDISNENRKLLRRSFGDLVRTLDDQARVQAIRELVDFSKCRDELEAHERMVLTWPEVTEMHCAGIEIGSHTVTHPFLSLLSDEQLKSELMDSKCRIESVIGSPVFSLSYPTGGRAYYDERTLKLASACGYRFAVSYEHNALPYSHDARFEIPRIHIELDVGQELFEAYTMMPNLFLRSFGSAAA